MSVEFSEETTGSELVPRSLKYNNNEFTFQTKLGGGSYGDVYEYSSPRGSVALKRVKCQGRDACRTDIHEEVRNITEGCEEVPVLASDMARNIVMPKLASLREVLRRSVNTETIASQVWSALSCMASKGVVYMDLKIDNVMYDLASDKALLGDRGSRASRADARPPVSTYWTPRMFRFLGEEEIDRDVVQTRVSPDKWLKLSTATNTAWNMVARNIHADLTALLYLFLVATSAPLDRMALHSLSQAHAHTRALGYSFQGSFFTRGAVIIGNELFENAAKYSTSGKTSYMLECIERLYNQSSGNQGLFFFEPPPTPMSM